MGEVSEVAVGRTKQWAGVFFPAANERRQRDVT